MSILGGANSMDLSSSPSGRPISASGAQNPYSGLNMAQYYANPQGVQGLSAAPSIGDSYGSYLSSARSRIASDLAQSLGDINASEMRGGAAIGQIPAQLQQIYGGAEGNMMGAVQAEQSAQKAAGLQTFQDKTGMSTAGAGPILAGQGGVAPVLAATQADQASRAGDVPLLQLGNSQLAQQQRGRAHMAAEDLYNQQDMLGAQLGSSHDIAQAQINAQYGSANNEFLRNAYLQNQQLGANAALAGAGYEGQYNLANLQGQYGVQQAQAYRGLNAAPPADLAGFASTAGQIDPGTASSIMNSSLFKNAVASIKPDGSNTAAVIRQQQQQGHARTAALLAQQYYG